MKKLATMAISVGLIGAMVAGGSLAYLTSEDSDVNVMTLGNVKIEQIEQERNDEGKLVDFTQNKPLFPAVFDGSSIPWAPEEEWVISDDEAWKVVAENSNVVDKFVTVKNTGVSEAYVRTLVAYEGDATYGPEGAYIHVVHNGSNVASDITTALVGNVEIDGVTYTVYSYTYPAALKAGQTTIPSLKQVYMNKTATNEVVANYGETYDILVLSQAVQTAGFADAATALNTAFPITDDNLKAWFTEMPEEFNGDIVKVEGADKTALVAAIDKAKDGDMVQLTEDTTIAGYDAGNKLTIDKAIILDLNGKTLTTECGWGGIDAKGGCSIINGTINHTGNTAAIKAFEVDKIENVTINVTETSGKTKGGIVVQNNVGNYIGSIKNVTITGATNGIECYRSTNDLAIGSIENVKISATANGVYLNGAGNIGKISNCEINGGNIGINAYLANLWNISLDIVNSTITGGTTGIDIWDEAKPNTGSTVTFNYDNATKFSGDREKIKVTLQEEITCTINGEKQDTPCDIRK